MTRSVSDLGRSQVAMSMLLKMNDRSLTEPGLPAVSYPTTATAQFSPALPVEHVSVYML